MAAHRGARRLVLGVVAAGLAIAVYLNGLHNPFVYDDHDTVLANPSLVDLSNVRFIVLYSLFRPAVNVSYALDRAVWGFDAFGFHVTNVLLHALVVVLFYVLCTCALTDGVRQGSNKGQTGVRQGSNKGQTGVRPGVDRTQTPDWPAFFAAAIFAVHPLLSEAVGYVSGRSEVLCAVGFLAALLLARSAILRPRPSTIAGAALAGAVAFASKETAIALPFVLMAYDAWVLRADGWRRRLTRVYLPVIGLLAVAATVRLATLWSAAPTIGRSPLANLLTQAVVIWRYLLLFVLPAGQTIMHEVRFADSIFDPAGLIALLALALAAVIAIRRRAQAPLVALGVAWFLLVLAPSSSVIPLREGMAEHRVYLAVAGMLLAAASALAPALATTTARAITAAVVAVLALLTIQRNQVWASPLTLWAEAADRAPGMWEPHFAYADALREARQCDKAIPEYETVVRLRPNHRDAVTNLGICLAQEGRARDADAAFRRSLDIDPQWVRGYTNLGTLAMTQRDFESARDYYLQALRVDPNNVLARMQLAQLYESVFHDYHSAARMCGEARAIAPFTPGVVECVERNQKLAAERDAGR